MLYDNFKSIKLTNPKTSIASEIAPLESLQLCPASNNS